MTAAERFGANLRRLRDAAGYSQEALSYLSGVNRTQVGNYELGNVMPKSLAVVRLAGALSVTPNDLLAGIEWEPNVYSPGRMVVRDDDA